MQDILKTIDKIRQFGIYAVVCIPIGIILMICCLFFFPFLFVGLIVIAVGGPLSLYAAIKIILTDFKNQEVNDMKTLWGILSFIGLGPIAEIIFANKAKRILSSQGSSDQTKSNESIGQTYPQNQQNVNLGVATGDITSKQETEIKQNNDSEAKTKAAAIIEEKISTPVMEEKKKASSSPSAGFSPSKDEVFHPVFALWNFLCRITLKKASMWIVLAIFSILTLVSMLIPLMMFNNNYWNLPENVFKENTINQFILIPSIIVCLGAGVQGILITLKIFIDSQKDGTEILIVSKPITRAQIIIARFTYLFMFGLSLSLINMLMVIIGMAIVGMEYYSASSIVIGGSFGASFLSFSVMGIIGALIGLFSNGKVARVLPIVILSFSSTGAMVAGQMMPMLCQSPTATLQENIVSNLKAQYIGKEIKYCKSTWNNNGPDYELIPAHIQSMETYSYNPFIKYDQISKQIYLDGTFNFVLDVTDNYSWYNGDNHVRMDIKVSSLISTKNISTNETIDKVVPEKPNENPPNKHDLSDFNSKYAEYTGSKVSEYISSIIPLMSANANPAYIVNYLNPISAFATVMGTTSFSSNPFASDGLAPNFSIHKISKSYWQIEIPDNTFTSTSQPEYIKKFASYNIITSQFDPSWAVALTWVGIFLAASVGTIAGYLRKDFK